MVNKDDAKSENVEIRFETKNLDDNIRNVNVVRIVFKNDGSPFELKDWDRLRKIAEGNPHEEKVYKFFF